ncbi:MAG: hypothetical protein ACPKOI_08060 [Pleomorphochaeta sp.]
MPSAQNKSFVSKAISNTDFNNVKISVFGINQLNEISQTFNLSQGQTNISFRNIPIGKNKIIKVDALDEAGNEIDGLTLFKLIDILPGNNSALINWETTPLGKIFYQLFLYDLNHSTSFSQLDSSIIETKVQEIITTNSLIHPELVDSIALAQDIIVQQGNIPQSNNYIVDLCNISLNLIGINNEILTIRISDPVSSMQQISSDGIYNFSFIPGIWNVEIRNNTDNIIYQARIEATTPGEICNYLIDNHGNNVPLSNPIDLSQYLTISNSKIQCTRTIYSETDDIDSIVHQELGTNFRVADWQDFASYEGQLDSLFDFLGIVDGQVLLITNGGSRYSSDSKQYALVRGIASVGANVLDNYGDEAWLGLCNNCTNIGILGFELSENNNIIISYNNSYGFENLSDQPNVSFSGNSNWIVSNVKAKSGSYSFCNGDISDNQNSIFSINEIVPSGYKLSKISFYYSTSTEANFDFLRFQINSINKLNVAGVHDWSKAEFDTNILTGQEYNLVWDYDKDASVSSYLDTVWIDDLILEFEPINLII